MGRAYISISSKQVPSTTNAHLYGELATKLPFAIEPSQRAAWEFQIDHLRQLAEQLPEAHFFLELLIPRMGRRADLVLLNAGIIFVVEYKLGASNFDRSALDQAYGYGLDLKHFHETSHARRIVPLLVATEFIGQWDDAIRWDEDRLGHPRELHRTIWRRSFSRYQISFPSPH